MAFFLSPISRFPTHFRFSGKTRRQAREQHLKSSGRGEAEAGGAPDWRVYKKVIE